MVKFQKLPKINRVISSTIGTFIGTVGVLILFKDLLFPFTRDTIWADDFDSKLIYWIVNWGYHIIFEMGQPFNFWDANSFYPHLGTLAYSDSLLGIQFLFAPLRTMGISPLYSLYLSLGGICIIGAALTNYALDRVGYFSIPERIFIIFSAHFSLSMLSFMIHYQLFGFHLAPAFFLFLFLFLRDLQAKYIFLMAITFSWGVSIAMYLAPMLFVLSIFLSIPMINYQIKNLGIKNLLKKIGIHNLVFVVIIGVLLYFIQFKPYFSIANNFPVQSIKETSTYSANFDSIFNGLSKFSFWYGPIEYPTYGAWEYSYFPGYVLLFLGLPTLIYYIGSSLRKIIRNLIYPKNKSIVPIFEVDKNTDNKEISKQFLLFGAILFLVTIILSWGPILKSNTSFHLPYYYLSKIIIGLREIRAPGRFGMFIPIPLAIFAIAFIRRFIKSKIHQNWIILLITLFVIIESLPKFPVFPFSIDKEGIYYRVAQEIQPNTPLLEFPVSGDDNYETIKIALHQLDGSTIHWGKMVVGYGSKSTSEYFELVDMDNHIRNDLSDPAIALQFGKYYEINYFLIHLSRYNPKVAQKWITLIRNSDAEILFETDDEILFSMNYELIK